MSSYCTDDTVGPWAEDKLSKLEKYLNAYTKILSNQRWCKNIVYIDAFAAMGKAEIRKYNKGRNKTQMLLSEDFEYDKDSEETAYINGSPLRALNLTNSFTHFLFIELNEERIKKLEQLKSDYPTKNIEIIKDDCNNAIFNYLKKFNWANTRALIFLDPFGMQVPWSTIEGIAKISEKNPVEIILNLPIQTTIERFLPRTWLDDENSKKRRMSYNTFFGSSEWFDLIYTSSGDLFGTNTIKLPKADDILASWYADRLKQLFGLASNPYKVTNTRQRGLYYLIWAGNQPVALKIAQSVLNQGNKVKVQKK